MNSNYVGYHFHSDFSNAFTIYDSASKFDQYVARAKECGMTALGFAEHGNIFGWLKKKEAIEAAGMKYIHAVEAYVTRDLEAKIKDNLHCVLIAKNYNGFLELNGLVSKSFNRSDGHFYYKPRISLAELFSTSDNIIVTSACIGGVLGETSGDVANKFCDFAREHKDRCFFEVAHHPDKRQSLHNIRLSELSKATGVRLILGTDTHVVTAEQEEARAVVQKGIFAGRGKKETDENASEENWDLRFRTYNEIVDMFKEQNSICEDDYMSAIENTNVLADMIEPFTLDRSAKYPHIYANPEDVFRAKIEEGIRMHPCAIERHGEAALRSRINEEVEVYKKTGTIAFMLLQKYLRDWEHSNGIMCGYGRGSVNGSMVAYLLGITEMDSMQHSLNFFRFLNPSRVTNADIDTDYSESDREKVKEFLLKYNMNLPNIRTAEIVTFNTVELKSAVRYVGKGLGLSQAEINSVCDRCGEADDASEVLRKKFSTLFRHVDSIRGTIMSVGRHASGVVVSDLPIDEVFGVCSIPSSDYPITMIDMKELDSLMFVKLDILGLDSIGVINSTCKLANIERISPDSVNLNDEAVWKDIRGDTTLIFQWESESAQRFLKKFMSDETVAAARERNPNFSMLKWLSFGNGLIRPACASFRDSVANGDYYDNGFDALNEFLAPEAGRIAMQETIMRFLVEFCGYTGAESDNVRRAIAKKKGTEDLLPEIERRFIKHCSYRYNMNEKRCEEVIKPFLQIILDASDYSFSWNHSDAYSATGYICGYLRHYYPYEFFMSALNTFDKNLSKTASIVSCAKRRGITISPPKWGYARSGYTFDKDSKCITKGLSAVKYMNKDCIEGAYRLSQRKKYNVFAELLCDLKSSVGMDVRQIKSLISIGFFSDFGNKRELDMILCCIDDIFKWGGAVQINKDKINGTPIETAITNNAVGITKTGKLAARYTLTNISAAMVAAERAIKEQHYPEYSVAKCVKMCEEVLGYNGYITGNEEDRRTLVVRGVYPVKRKSDGKQFGYSVTTTSVGSGVEGRFTVLNRIYDNNPIKEGDVVRLLGVERDGKYFRLLSYKVLETEQ